jgi:serine protease Do
MVKSKSALKYLWFFVITSLLVITVLTGCALPGEYPESLSSTPAPNAASSFLPDFAAVISRVRPSVVAITTQATGYSLFGGAFTQEGAGSGWILTQDGMIVTNNHVIDGAISITVTMENGNNFPAQVIKTDSATDLALIKIKAQDLPALKIGNSAGLQVGDWVVAIGNSLGMGISATKGIVSALDVSISTSSRDTLKNLIQTDAAINPGNSGGPLVNLRGEVIGINSIKVSQVGVEGMGYAISINEAKRIIDQWTQAPSISNTLS